MTLAAAATASIKVPRLLTLTSRDAVLAMIAAAATCARDVMEITCVEPEPSLSMRPAIGWNMTLMMTWNPLKPASTAAFTEADGVRAGEGVALACSWRLTAASYAVSTVAIAIEAGTSTVRSVTARRNVAAAAAEGHEKVFEPEVDVLRLTFPSR